MNNSEIYQKLISIKPFFEKTSNSSPQNTEESQKIIHTYKTVNLVRGNGNVFYNADKPIVGGSEPYVTLLEFS